MSRRSGYPDLKWDSSYHLQPHDPSGISALDGAQSTILGFR